MNGMDRLAIFDNICNIGYPTTDDGVERKKRTRDSVLDYCPSPDWKFGYDLLYNKHRRVQRPSSSGFRHNTSSVDPNSNSEVEGAQ